MTFLAAYGRDRRSVSFLAAETRGHLGDFSGSPRSLAPVISELVFQLVTGVLNVNGGMMQRKRALTASTLTTKGLPVGPLHDQKVANT